MKLKKKKKKERKKKSWKNSKFKNLFKICFFTFVNPFDANPNKWSNRSKQFCWQIVDQSGWKNPWLPWLKTGEYPWKGILFSKNFRWMRCWLFLLLAQYPKISIDFDFNDNDLATVSSNFRPINIFKFDCSIKAWEFSLIIFTTFCHLRKPWKCWIYERVCNTDYPQEDWNFVNGCSLFQCSPQILFLFWGKPVFKTVAC